MNCLTDDAMLELEAGLLDEAATAQAREHVASCKACHPRAEALSRLTHTLRADAPSRLTAAMVVERATARPRAIGRTVGLLLATSLAAGTITLALRTPEDGFSARGDRTPWKQRVAMKALGAPIGLLEPGAAVPRDALFTIAAFGVAPADRLQVLAFIVDGRGEVHWVAPEWTNPQSVPVPLALTEQSAAFVGAPGGAVRTLAHSVQFSDLPLGRATFITITAEQGLEVLRIERLADKSEAGVRAAFPEALIRGLELDVTASDGGR